MLYHAHELTSLATAPLRFGAEAQQMILRHPLNPLSYTPAGRALAASAELFEAALRPYEKPVFGIENISKNGITTRLQEQVVLQTPFCELRHFQKQDAEKQPTILLVAPMSGHFATLLRGTVTTLAEDHNVYITDWRDARDIPLREGRFDLDDYIDHIIQFIRLLGPDTHIVAVCQPAVPVLAACSLLAADKDPAQPKSMTLMGGPIDTRIRPTEPNRFAKAHDLNWFEQFMISRVPVSYPGYMRRVYPGFLQLTGFMSMNLDRHFSAHLQHFDNLVRGDGDSVEAHRDFYDEYRAVMDLPADYYLQTVERVFQNHDLALGTFKYRGTVVDPAQIKKTALMTVEGELDDISAPGQTLAAHDLCSSLKPNQKDHYLQESVGHYGVFNGRRWRQEIAPRVTEFIARQTKS